MSDMTWLQERLKDRRVSANLSFGKLAAATGISKAALHDMESGKSCNPTMKTLMLISDVYSMSVSELISSQPINEEIIHAVKLIRFIKRLEN